MMQHEFEKLTKMTVTAEEYADIEERYMAFDGDKQAFARAFVEEWDGPAKIYAARAREIARLRDCLAEQGKAHRLEVADLEKQIADLKAKLDAELEWKPAENTGTNMDQGRYENLVASGREMSDEEAVKLVVEETGFAQERVVIVREVSRYEVNKHHQLRKAETYTRAPFYDATDWNYIRFNVLTAAGGYQWELVNGELREYNS